MTSFAALRTEFTSKSTSLLLQLRDLVLPPQCLITGDPVENHGQLSPEAWHKLNFIAPPFCRLCGIPFLVSVSESLICVSCAAPDETVDAIVSEKALDQVRAALCYDDFSARLVLGLKYADRLDGVQSLAVLMAQAGSELFKSRKSILVPVPLHASRLRDRRFNQAALLANALGGMVRRKVVLNLLLRQRATPQQQGLSAKGRKRNVKGAFGIREQHAEIVRGRDFVLVDDVLTTGSTLLECAKVLKRAGAANVSALVLARVVNSEIVAI